MRRKKGTLAGFGSLSPALLLAIVTAIGVGAIGWETLEERIIAGAVTALVFVVSVRAAVRGRRVAAAARGEQDTDPKPHARILESLQGLVWQGDVSGERTYVNEHWCAWTGQPKEEALGSGWLDAVHHEDRSRVESVHRLAVTSHGPFDLEYRLRLADGSYRAVHDHVTPVQDERGAFEGFIGLGVRVRGRRGESGPQEVEQAHKLNATINEQAAKLASEFETLDAARGRAEQGDQLKAEYLAALAGELRDPIEVTRQVVDLLQNTELTETQTEHLDRIRSATDHLHIVQIRAEKLGVVADPEQLELDEFNLRRTIEQVLAEQAPEVEEKTLKLSSVIASTVPAQVLGDAVRVRRMLVDLADAAIRLALRGRVTFRASQELVSKTERHLRFAFTLLDGDVDEDLVQRAFYPAEAVGKGESGLGLGECRRLAQLMRGNVGIERDGKGALTFWMTAVMEEVNPNWEGRRSSSRLSQESVKCSVGTVLDLSLGGMRVRCPKPIDGTIDVEIFDDEETIKLQAEVAWAHRIGFGKHEAGLKFVEVDEDAHAQLSRLATRNRLRRVMEAA